MTPPAEDPTRPTLRVLSGDAKPEEIAAVLAVVAARSGGDDGAPAEPDRADTWASHGHAHRHVRTSFTPSTHGWKTSFWPR